MVKEMEEQKEMIDAYDWASWEKKGLDAATIAEVKAVMAAGVPAAPDRAGTGLAGQRRRGRRPPKGPCGARAGADQLNLGWGGGRRRSRRPRGRRGRQADNAGSAH